MPHGNELMYVDNELEQLTRALASSSGHSFLAACEESAHGSTTGDLVTGPATRMVLDPLQQLARAAIGSNTFELSMCESSASVSPKLHEVPPPSLVPSCSPACGCKNCVWLDDIFANNRRWAKGLSRINPNFFADMAQEDTPSLLWIGCADSRVVPNRVTGLQPGSLYVHRNVGNVAKPCDPNCMSALEYSVKSLEVQHVVVCGHYGCSAVTAAMKDPSKTAGILNFWVSDIRQLLQQHRQELQGMSQERQLARLCELNVVRQVMNICNSAVVRAAWERGQVLHVHGLIYDVKTGLLTRLVEPISAADQDFALRAAAEQLHENQEMAAAFSAATRELLRAQGYNLPESVIDPDGLSQVPSSPARSLARAAAAMQQRAPGSIPSTPRSPSVSGSEPATATQGLVPAAGEVSTAAASDAVDVQSLQEELAWLRSSEACAVDAAQHLMEQTRALLKEKQDMSKKMAEQSETIKWLQERLQFLESESEQLRASAPTQLIKRFRELQSLPPEGLSPDLQQELHLLQGLLALGSQLFPAPVSPRSTSSLPPVLPWDKSNDFFPPAMDMHFNSPSIPVWSYTVQDAHPHSKHHLHQQKATLPSTASKLALLESLSHSPVKNRKAPAPDPSPIPTGSAPVVPESAADVTPLASTEPDLWYLLGAYAPSHGSHGSHSHPAGVSSPSSHSLPPSSVLSPRDSIHPGPTASAHYYRASFDSNPSTSGTASTDDKADRTAGAHGAKAALDAGSEQLKGLTASHQDAADNAKVAVTGADADAGTDTGTDTGGAEADAGGTDAVVAAAAGTDTCCDTDAVAAAAASPGAELPVGSLPDLRIKVAGHGAAPSSEEMSVEGVQPEVHGASDSARPVVGALNASLSTPTSPGGVSVAGTLPLSESYWELPELPEWLRAAAAQLQAARENLPLPADTPQPEKAHPEDNNHTHTTEPVPQQASTASADLAAAAAVSIVAGSVLKHPSTSGGTAQTAAVASMDSGNHTSRELPLMESESAVEPPLPHLQSTPQLPPSASQPPSARQASPAVQTHTVVSTASSSPVPLPTAQFPAVVSGTQSSTVPFPTAQHSSAVHVAAPVHAGPRGESWTSAAAAAASTSAAAAAVRSALPPLPPKKALSLRSGSGHSKKRLVVKLGSQMGGQAQSTRPRKEKRKSSRSRTSSAASTISSVSSRSVCSSLDFSPSSYTASALNQMAEDLRRLEDALWEEDDDNFPNAVQLQQQLQHQLAGARKQAGQLAKGKGQLRTASKPHHSSGKAKVTFSNEASTSSQHIPFSTHSSTSTCATTSPTATATIPTTTTTLPGPSHNSAVPPDFQFPQPTARPCPPHSSLLPIPEEQLQHAQHPAPSAQHADAADAATHQACSPSNPSRGSTTKQRGGGWLGAVGRATLAVAVGVLIKRGS